MPLQIIVPSTKCLHSTLGALGCPLLAGCWASSGHRVCLDKFQSLKPPDNGVLEGASMFLVLRAPLGAVAGEGEHLWERKFWEQRGGVPGRQGLADRPVQFGNAKWDVLGSACMVWVHPLALKILLP